MSVHLLYGQLYTQWWLFEIFCAISHFDYSCEQSYSQRRLPWVFISFLTFRRQLVGYDSHLQRTLFFLKLGAIVTQILTWNQKGLAVFFFLVTSQLSDLEQCWLCLVLSGKNWTQHIILETLSIVHISLVRILFVLVKSFFF